MARELLLLRHGKSDWSQETDDYHRPLKDRGKRGAQRMGVWLQQQEFLPDYTLASPATRAIETARKLCKTMGLDARQIKQDKRIYAAGVSDLLQVLSECPDKASRVLLVGHNPGLEDLLRHLAVEPIPLPSDGNLLPTATLARLILPDGWRKLPAHSAQLLSITRPKGLPKKFPFPDFRGKELRDRPSYYYTQSSVIPYRVHEGELQILLVRSSQKKHWVVPKGIGDPGLTLQESAAKEAWEEAGIEGEVETLPLGTYRYEKWGGECTVHVYPMAVQRLLSEDSWEESHRGREWVTAEQAMTQLNQPELRPLVEALVKQQKSA